MKNPRFTRNLLLAALAVPCASQVMAGDALISPVDMRNAIVVQIDNINGSVISGRVINNSGHRIKDPELTIRYDWLWADEYRPGDDNPGWATHYVLPQELGANESTAFTYDPGRPLPHRNDGHITPSVAVTGYTQFN